MGMSNARGSGSDSGTSTTANDSSNPSLRDSTQASGSGSGSDSGPASGGCNYGTTVEFGDTGYISTAEEVNCDPPTVQVPIIVGYPGTCPVSVNYTTQSGTAIAGTDYTAVSGTASIPAGSTGPYWVNIPILDDGTDESVGSEVFYVNLSSPQNATIGGDNPFKVYISEPTPQGSTDTLVWNPCQDSDGDDNYNASNPLNWYDQTLGRQLQNGDPGPGSGTPIIFDAYAGDTPHSNAPITWDHSFTVASITLNQYTNVQTVDADLTTSGYVDEDIGVSNFVVAFAAAADLNLPFGQDVMGNFNWQAGGKTNVNGAVVIIGNKANLNQSSASPIIINSGSVNIGPANATSGTSTFKLTADITVNANGFLNFYEPTANATLVDNTGTSALISNKGTTTLRNAPGGGPPLLLFHSRTTPRLTPAREANGPSAPPARTTTVLAWMAARSS